MARPVHPRRRAGVRGVALLLLAGCAAVLVTAAMLRPDPRGLGTHEQLGVAGCGLLLRTGIPCPTCGMTTAFAHAVRGQFFSAVRAQPAGALLAVGVGLTAVAAVSALVRGQWPVRLHRVPPALLFGALLALLVGGWAYKVAAVTRTARAAPGAAAPLLAAPAAVPPGAAADRP